VAEVEELRAEAAMTRGRVMCGERVVGEVDLVFSHIDQNLSGLEFPEENFVFTEGFMALLKTAAPQARERIKL
jgi:hypothetical protein